MECSKLPAFFSVVGGKSWAKGRTDSGLKTTRCPEDSWTHGRNGRVASLLLKLQVEGRRWACSGYGLRRSH